MALRTIYYNSIHNHASFLNMLSATPMFLSERLLDIWDHLYLDIYTWMHLLFNQCLLVISYIYIYTLGYKGKISNLQVSLMSDFSLAVYQPHVPRSHEVLEGKKQPTCVIWNLLNKCTLKKHRNFPNIKQICFFFCFVFSFVLLIFSNKYLCTYMYIVFIFFLFSLTVYSSLSS